MGECGLDGGGIRGGDGAPVGGMGEGGAGDVGECRAVVGGAEDGSAVYNFRAGDGRL